MINGRGQKQEVRMKFTQTRLLVHNFDDCFTFYAQTLGLKTVWGSLGELYASFECQNRTTISIYNAQSMLDSTEHVKIDRRIHVDKFVLVLGVDDVDQSYKELLKKDVHFINEPHDEPGWGNRVVHLRDPEGNLIELNQMMSLEDWDEELLAAKEKYDFEL